MFQVSDVQELPEHVILVGRKELYLQQIYFWLLQGLNKRDLHVFACTS